MKMSTLRDQSKPLLYGLIVLFVLAMGNFANIFSSANPNSGDSENCDPTIFVACSDDDNIIVTKDEYYARYNNSIDYFHNQVTFGSQYNATDRQLDTLNALNAVWNSIINEKVMNKYINDLDLISYNPSPEMVVFIKNYPNFNSTFKSELELYKMFIVDSVFNQEQYEESVEMGSIDEMINASFRNNYPEQASILDNRGTNRWNNWFATMKRQIANIKLNYIINATQSLSNLELSDQLLIDSSIFNFDYLTYSISDANDISITDEEINSYFNEIKNDESYVSQESDKRTIQFVKWNLSDLNSTEKDSIQKLAKKFRKDARKYGFKETMKNNTSFNVYAEVALANDFSLSKSGLSTQISTTDSTKSALYNVIGAGREIIKFVFANEIGQIKLLNINSDRANNGFNDIGVFYIKNELAGDDLTLEETGIKNRLENELSFKKKYDNAKPNFEVIIQKYEQYLIDEGYENLSDADLNDFDPLDQWVNGSEEAQEKILFRTHNGSINEFLSSFINTSLRKTLFDDNDLKGFLLSLNEGLNYTIKAIDNDNLMIIRMNKKPTITIDEINAYKKNELTRLVNSQSGLFLEAQKESANIKDNRTLIY